MRPISRLPARPRALAEGRAQLTSETNIVTPPVAKFGMSSAACPSEKDVLSWSTSALSNHSSAIR